MRWMPFPLSRFCSTICQWVINLNTAAAVDDFGKNSPVSSEFCVFQMLPGNMQALLHAPVPALLGLQELPASSSIEIRGDDDDVLVWDVERHTISSLKSILRRHKGVAFGGNGDSVAGWGWLNLSDLVNIMIRPHIIRIVCMSFHAVLMLIYVYSLLIIAENGNFPTRLSTRLRHQISQIKQHISFGLHFEACMRADT